MGYAEGCVMFYERASRESEIWPEFLMQKSGVVALCWESAAFWRAVRAEGCDYGVSTGFEGRNELVRIGPSLFWFGEEVKDCSIMPEVVAVGW